MLFLILTILLMSALLDRSLRTGRLDLLKLRLRFDLFALRDELRRAAILGEAPLNQWFEYLDTTITKTIDNIESLNFWEISTLMVAHGSDKSILKAYDRLVSELQRQENWKLAEIYSNFINLNVKFLVRRHRGPVVTFTALAKIVVRADNLIDRCSDLVRRVLASAPETSTLLRYS